jgi:hypothetical protein
MKIEGKLLEKLSEAGIEIEEVEREYLSDDGKTEIVKNQFAKFPCARDFVPVRFSDRIEEKDYLESDFENFKFIKDYEAIWSPKLKVIECELQPVVRFAAPFHYLLRRLSQALSEETDEQQDEFARYEFEESEDGIKLSIGSASLDYAILSFLKDKRPRFDYARRRPTLRIENVDISRHDKAKKVLEKVGNSLLFKVDMTLNLGMKLAEDRDIRRSYFRRKKSEHDLDKSFPNYEYDNEPMSLYWYAKGAVEMPLLQFLALYQILEFYFPIFSQKDAHQQVKNLIKDPRFNPNKDSDISRILSSITQNKNQLGFGSELDQLKSTLASCITKEEIREVIENDDMVDFYKDKQAKSLANKSLNIGNESADLVNECAERIYEIRCRVVHTKSSDKNYELLLPSSPELKYLMYDITILEMIAKKVMVSTSRLLKI